MATTDEQYAATAPWAALYARRNRIRMSIARRANGLMRLDFHRGVRRRTRAHSIEKPKQCPLVDDRNTMRVGST